MADGLAQLLHGIGGIGLAAGEGLVPEVGAAAQAFRETDSAMAQQQSVAQTAQVLSAMFADVGTDSAMLIARALQVDPIGTFGTVGGVDGIKTLLDQLRTERDFDQGAGQEQQAAEQLKQLLESGDFRSANRQDQFASLVGLGIPPGDAEKIVENLQTPGSVDALDFTDKAQRRDDIERISRGYREVADTFFALKDVIEGGEGPLRSRSAITQFLKSLDPTSTVRETEQEIVIEARGVSDSLLNFFERWLSGDVLTPEQREEMIDVARDAVRQRAQRQQQFEEGERSFLMSVTTPDVVDDIMGGLGLSERDREEFLTAPKPGPIDNVDDARKALAR